MCACLLDTEEASFWYQSHSQIYASVSHVYKLLILVTSQYLETNSSNFHEIKAWNLLLASMGAVGRWATPGSYSVRLPTPLIKHDVRRNHQPPHLPERARLAANERPLLAPAAPPGRPSYVASDSSRNEN